MVHIFVFFYTKNISKMQEKLIQMSATPPPPSLRAESLYQCRRAHSGHRSLEGRRPLTSQEDASHVNHHKNIKTAFMFVQPFAHSDISHPFRDRHYALGGTSDLTSVRNIVCITSERSDWKDGELLYLNVKKEEKLVPKDSFTYTVK